MNTYRLNCSAPADPGIMLAVHVVVILAVCGYAYCSAQCSTPAGLTVPAILTQPAVASDDSKFTDLGFYMTFS